MTLKADIFKLLRERKTEEKASEAENAKRLADNATFLSQRSHMAEQNSDRMEMFRKKD